MDILKHLMKNAEQVEVVCLQDEKTTIEFEANKLKASKVAETKGIAVRVVRNGKLGFSASSDARAVEKLAANALESAAYGDQTALVFPGVRPALSVATYDQAIADLPISRLVEIGREILDLILSVDPDIKVNISLERSVQSTNLRNQTGLEIAFQRSPLSIGVEIDRIEGDDVLILYDQTGTTLWEKDYLAFVHRLVEKLKLARHITTFRSGNMPVLFSPTGTLALGLPLMQGLNGKNVYKGTSPMASKFGEKLFDDKVSVVDDGTIDGRFASAPYDDEGVPHRRNALVDRGVLKGFLYDLKTAVLSGAESTGNASRGLFNPPEPARTNLLILPGNQSLADMIAGIDEGLLVEELLGLGQGNIISGAFSNPLSLAFKIEKGQIVGRVKDVAIAGNVYELLKNVTAISRETLWIYNSLCLPYILLPEMNIVAKG